MENKTVHLIGICGTAMGSLAGLLKEMGYQVSGSDQNVYPPMSTKLRELGIKIMEGYRPENLQPEPDLVIVGNALTRNHSEVQALLSSKIPYMSLPQAMGQFLIKDRHSIVIAGTHGKTTTTSICAWIAASLGWDPGFMIGGIPLNFPNSFAIGKGNYFVIEGDEYDTAFFDKVPKFIHYKPRSVILTGIEFDHADIYKELDSVKEAFKMLLKLIPEDGTLVYNGEDENISSILSTTKCKNLLSYGSSKNLNWALGEVNWTRDYSEFEAIYKGSQKFKFKAPIFGEYNLKNALASIGLFHALGADLTKVSKALETFKGVKRRQEVIGTPGGVTVIDDFAHHPTAVDVTLSGVKKRFKDNKVIAVFEPRSATSRRKVFEESFATALAQADGVFLSLPFDQSKIPEADRMNPERVMKFLNDKFKGSLGCHLETSVDSIVDKVKSVARPGDVVLVMSNGGFGGIYQKLLDRLA